jgi:hypothetical protein
MDRLVKVPKLEIVKQEFLSHKKKALASIEEESKVAPSSRSQSAKQEEAKEVARVLIPDPKPKKRREWARPKSKDKVHEPKSLLRSHSKTRPFNLSQSNWGSKRHES